MLTFNNKAIKIGSGHTWISNTYIPPMTLRCVFTQAPSSNTNWTVRAVDEDNLIYDVTRTNVQWNKTFLSNVAEVIGQGDCSTVTTTQGLFSSKTTLTSVCNLSFPASTSFTNMFSGCTKLTTVGSIYSTSALQATNSMFNRCNLLASVPLFDTSSVTDMKNMFRNCYNLTQLPQYSTSSATIMGGLCYGCSNLESVPLFDTSSVTTFIYIDGGSRYGAFGQCTALKTVPLFDTSSATNTSYMFSGCTAVESGALALYTQASTQTTPPTSYSGMFANCGSGTTTGAAELAQIPASWGGTGA